MNDYERARTAELMKLYTRNTWQVFNSLGDGQLNQILQAAGVVMPARRAAKMEAVLLVWFSGKIPDRVEFWRLNAVYDRL